MHTDTAPSPATDWPQRSLRAVWHPCTQMARAEKVPPLAIARGAGPWLYDYDGRRYFDANSSWWVNLFGHADAGINDAIKHQLDTLPHVMLAGCTHAPAVLLAEKLSALTGGALGHTFFASDGASAVEIALKMSFHSWRNRGQTERREFVCLRHGYHGETLGALSVTDVALYRNTYAPLLLTPTVAGQTPIGSAPGTKWYSRRFNMPYLRDPLLDRGIAVETLHIDVDVAIREALAAHAVDERADAIVMCHVSHAYEDGASLYFTAVFPQQLGDTPQKSALAAREQWLAVKRAATDAIVASGGTISHHHGVGTDHAAWIAEEKGPIGVSALAAVKDDLDPTGAMNPGKLLPPG